MNMIKSSSSSGGGIGFVGLLTVAFIVLKLCKVIDWSWWWVLAPIWIAMVIVPIILVGAFVALLISRRATRNIKRY